MNTNQPEEDGMSTEDALDSMERHLVDLLDYTTKRYGSLDKTGLAKVDQLAWALNQMGSSQETLDAVHNAAYQTVRETFPPDDGTAQAMLRAAAVAMRSKFLPGVHALWHLSMARMLDEVADQLAANQESGNPVTLEAVNLAHSYLTAQRLM